MSQRNPPCHFRLSFNRFGRRYRHQLANSTPRQQTILLLLVARC